MQGDRNAREPFLNFPGMLSDSHVRSGRHASHENEGEKNVVPDFAGCLGYMSRLEFVISSNNIPRVL